MLGLHWGGVHGTRWLSKGARSGAAEQGESKQAEERRPVWSEKRRERRAGSAGLGVGRGAGARADRSGPGGVVKLRRGCARPTYLQPCLHASFIHLTTSWCQRPAVSWAKTWSSATEDACPLRLQGAWKLSHVCSGQQELGRVQESILGPWLNGAGPTREPWAPGISWRAGWASRPQS